MKNLEGKVAVVTGAASGIGRALATRLSRENMTVVLADIDAAGLDGTAVEVHEVGRRALCVRTDVSNPAEMDSLAAQVEAEFGGTDLLCLNAGVFRGGLIWESPIEDWEWVTSINVYGVINGIRAFVPKMIERGTEAHIEITSSMAGLIATGMSGVYTVSKFAAFAIAEVLANDLALTNAPIGVSVVCPGAVATAIADSQRNREHATTTPASATAMDVLLRDFCAAGREPSAAAAEIVTGIKNGDFLIPITSSFAEFVGVRSEALQRRELPPFQMFD